MLGRNQPLAHVRDVTARKYARAEFETKKFVKASFGETEKTRREWDIYEGFGAVEKRKQTVLRKAMHDGASQACLLPMLSSFEIGRRDRA